MSDDESLSRYFDRLYMHHHQRLSASQHQGGRRAAATMCLVMIAVVFGALHQANGACLGTGSSIRIMNYNVALLIPPFDNEAEIGMEDMDRVDAIANRILHGGGDPDVVALEEVWRIDAQIRFILKLQAKYPHYVKNQLGGQWWTPAYTHDRQGGLMLFSKYPLAQFTNTVDTPWFLVNGRTGGSTFSIAGPNTQVAATMFTTCSSYDCLQDKGAVMVRILNECTQQVFNVVWTHLQASYDDADQNAKNGFFNDRLAQLTAIKRMITTSLTSSQLKNEAVYFVGDLNIDGNLHKPLTTEWTTHFSSTAVDGGFFACNTPTCTFNPPASHTGTFLKDSWAFESSPTDFGPTAAWSDIGAANYDLDAGFPSFFMAGKRFDCIFHNVPSERDLCMQHIVVAHDMKGAVDDKKGNAKGKNYSDHLPIRGDFNKAFARCTPRRKDASNPFGAETVDVTSGPTDAFPHAGDTSTRIANPGGMQWYILGKAGTYSMPISPGFKRVIYQGGDLSTPMDLYGAEKSERYGFKYSLTEPPYFVRVFWGYPHHSRQLLDSVSQVSVLGFGQRGVLARACAES